jgi:hypothetical protein
MTSPHAFDPLDPTTWEALLGPTEMGRIWRVGKSQFHRLNQQGAFDQFKVRPAIGPKCYSAALVKRYLTGEPVFAKSFASQRGGVR